jgi:hypothetical protein
MNDHKPNILLIGSDNFRTVVTEGTLVDKSEYFIPRIIDNEAQSILITYPRRWGKTLNMDMLKDFLSIDVDEYGNKKSVNANIMLFCGGVASLGLKGNRAIDPLAICQINHGEYMKYQGQYPVIFISFKDSVGDSYEQILDKLKTTITKLYRHFEYLQHSEKLSFYMKAELDNYLKGNISESELRSSLYFLSELLYKHHKEKVYVLVDEYDKPVNYLLENGVGKKDSGVITQVSKLITYIFSESSKTNPYVEKTIIMGIFDTLKKEGGSGFNNVKVYGINDAEFSKSFGFSDEEVKKLIDRLEFKNNSEIVQQNIKDWYNGYSLPLYSGNSIQVYTPWAVINYLSDASKGKLEPINYWSRSGASVILNDLLKILINSGLTNKFHLLAKGNEQVLAFDESTSLLQYDVSAYRKPEALISYLLLNSGYLTVRKENGEYFFKVPNFEVKKEFATVIERELLQLDVSFDTDYIKTLSELGLEKVKFEKFLLKSLSGLQNSVIKQAVESIIARDTKFLHKLVESHSDLKCYDKHLNFNLLQIGALSGDLVVFSLLLKLCDNDLMSSEDKISKLKLADFAYLSGNSNIVAALTEKNVDTITTFSVPTVTESMVCYPVGLLYIGYNLAFASMLTASIKLFSKQNTPKDISIWKALAVGIGTDVALNVIKETLKHLGGSKFELCKGYDYYQKIETSSPKDFKSLKQFEKYALEHASTYVSLGQECKDGYLKVAELTLPIFDYDNEQVIVFGLCHNQNNDAEL